MAEDRKKIIEVRNLYKIFGNHPEKAIALLQQGSTREEVKKNTGHIVGLNDLTFDIFEGEIFVLMGLSGSGKSTLLRCFNRLIKPSKGMISINGVDITKQSKAELRELRRTLVSMVFQRFALFPHRTIVENVEYGLEINGVSKAKRKEAALAALETVKLKGWADAYPHQISGGMQQRVGLARALVLNPKIILMDEAFSALDPLIRSDMQDELIELQRTTNNTIIFVSHDLDEALKIGHRILILKEGRMMQCGTPEEILSNPSNDHVRKFMQNADFSKVLTASSLMQKPKALAFFNQTARVILYKMGQSALSKIYVIENKTKQLLGYVTVEDVDKAIKNKHKDLSTIIRNDFVAVDKSTPVSELLEKSVSAPLAIAVVTGNNILEGIITRSNLIAGIGKVEVA